LSKNHTHALLLRHANLATMVDAQGYGELQNAALLVDKQQRIT